MSLEVHGLAYLSMSGLATLSRACPSLTPVALAACGYFLKGFVSLGLAAQLSSEDGGCSWMCCRISLAAQVCAGRGGGPEHVCTCSEAGLELPPFCWRTGRNLNLHPREEKSVHNIHSSFQQRPGSLCLVSINPPGVLGPPVATSPARLIPLPLGSA